MQTYTAPLRDMRFVLDELHDSAALRTLPGLEDMTPDVLNSILEEAGKFFTSVLLPLNASGDAEGCRYEDGAVRTPKGFKEAYKAFVDGGWGSLSSDPAYGGQGVPKSVGKLVEEMICGCNLSFGLYPGLSHGAYLAIKSHGSDALKNLYLPKLVNGEWTGTMCLTESHCGTDLGLLRTRAVPQADGSYRVNGSKIFISAGEHDLAGNIVHLVLARMQDSPPGIRGISLFVVPKFLPNSDGTVGARNGVRCTGIEHKMGIKASATCQITFDEATAWLVGEPNKGMRAMFVMMNSERLSVGTQGLGLGEVAYQSAVAYAKDRLQGRSLSGPKHPDKPADPIIVHPDVRRMLMTMRAYNEGCRALGVLGGAMRSTAWSGCRIRPSAPKPRISSRLMTPVVKALFTDLGFDAVNLGLQTYGGHGFIVDHGMEQFVRDARIAMIYEGTNGVQALDLVGRKLPAKSGRSLRAFFHPVPDSSKRTARIPKCGPLVQPLAKAFGALQLATGLIAKRAARSRGSRRCLDRIPADARPGRPRLHVGADGKGRGRKTAGGSGRGRRVLSGEAHHGPFYIDRILPQVGALLYAIKSGKASMMALDEAAF